MFVKYAIIFFCTPTLINTAKIVAIIPTPSISHQTVFAPLMKELSNRGHRVSVLTTNAHLFESFNPNMTIVNIQEESYQMWNKYLNFMKFKERNANTNNILYHYYVIMVRIFEMQMTHPAVQNLLKEEYDLCIFEAILSFTLPLKDIFKCKTIQMTSLSATFNNLNAFGNPTNPIAYIDIGTKYIENVGLWQRLEMVYDYLVYHYNYYVELMPMFDDMAKRIFSSNVKSIVEYESEVDMLFIHVHPIFGDIRPIVPAVIHTGFMHIVPNKTLPTKLKKILDDAENGVIYLSLGSNVKFNNLPQTKINAFMDAFKELPYTILWKFENETLDGKPKNVHISKWFPQQDILAHPNVKCFITQGGQQSLEEAIYYKVPLIGVPFISDQHTNVKKMIKFGIGTGMNFHTLDKQTILNSVYQILKNATYREHVEKLSRLLKDQPQTFMEKTIWWIEYVLRNNGAQHLKSPASKIPFYQYFLVDIVVIVLICLILFMFIILILCNHIRKRIDVCFKSKLKTS